MLEFDLVHHISKSLYFQGFFEFLINLCFVYLRLYSFVCRKIWRKIGVEKATPNSREWLWSYIYFSSFFISFCTLTSSTWLYRSIVMVMSACPIMYCRLLTSTPLSAALVQNVCLNICGCVKYRTKKILFFSAEDYLTLPSGSPSTFIIFW